MKKDKWEKLLSKHKDSANNFHISRLRKIGTKKDLIKDLKQQGSFEYILEQNENGEFRGVIGKLGNTYYLII